MSCVDKFLLFRWFWNSLGLFLWYSIFLCSYLEPDLDRLLIDWAEGHGYMPYLESGSALPMLIVKKVVSFACHMIDSW